MRVVCSVCHNQFEGKNRKELKRKYGIKWIGDARKCGSCFKKNKEEHREYLKRDVLGIRKREDLLKEWQQKREQRANLPKIKGSRDTGRIKGRHYYSGLWLTKIEKYIIYKKYSSMGYNSDFVKKKYEEIRNVFEKMLSQWKEKELDNTEINKRFKEEFAKLIETDK